MLIRIPIRVCNKDLLISLLENDCGSTNEDRHKYCAYAHSIICHFYISTVVIPLLRGILKLADTSQKRKVILFYTTVFGAKPSTIWSTTSLDTCEVPCRISDDKSSLLQSDAVIFHGRDMPETMPTRRTTNQRWVYFIQENPHYTSPEPLKYNGMFNWTMTYKRSSDVWAPYGTYRTVKNNDLRRSYFSSGAGDFLFVFLLVAGVAKTLESLSKRGFVYDATHIDRK